MRPMDKCYIICNPPKISNKIGLLVDLVILYTALSTVGIVEKMKKRGESE